MKNIICKFIGIIAITACASYSCGSIVAEKGNGYIATSERSVTSFEKIKLVGSVNVRYHASDKYRVVVTVDSNLEEYIKVSTKNNVLTIKNKNNGILANRDVHFNTDPSQISESSAQYLVDIYCPYLTGIKVKGSGRFEGIDKIISSTLTVDISGSGKVDGSFECEKISAKIKGSGKITVAGTANNAKISIYGSGRLDGLGFDTKIAAVKISGSGEINIGISDKLTADLSGDGSGGELTYRGEPKIESKVKGNGRIVKL